MNYTSDELKVIDRAAKLFPGFTSDGKLILPGFEPAIISMSELQELMLTVKLARNDPPVVRWVSMKGHSITQGKAEVWVVWSDGKCECALEFYDDELHFQPYEFQGKTQEQINDLFRRKDIAYLQS